MTREPTPDAGTDPASATGRTAGPTVATDPADEGTPAPVEGIAAGGSAPAAPPKPPRSAKVLFMTTTLALSIFVMLFATLVAHGLQVAPRQWVWTVGGVAMWACVVLTIGAPRFPRAVAWLGWLIPLGLAATALVVPLALVLAVVFALVWLICLRTGADIDRERQARHQAELEHHRATAGA